jgi:hypothetical protein
MQYRSFPRSRSVARRSRRATAPWLRGTNRRAADPDAERVRETERTRLARATDVELCVAARSEAAARRELGGAAQAFLAGRGYQRLGFVRVGDYARERLGISGRALESAAWVAARLDALPRIGTAFDRGEISWAQARTLCGVAPRDEQDGRDEQEWLTRARAWSARELEASAKAARTRSGAPPDPDADDGTIEDEPAVRVRIACPARVRALWRHAAELASRVAGQCLVPWRAAEIIAAEASSGRPPDASFGDRALLAALRLARRQHRIDGVATGPIAAISNTPAGPSGAGPGAASSSKESTTTPPVRAAQALCDPFTLDARLVFAMHTIRTAEPRIGRLLRVLVDLKLYRTLGFTKVEDYVRERLGMSARKAWALLKVERTVRRTAAFAGSYEKGLISWTRVLTLLPVLCRENEGAWLTRASMVTAQRLAEEVDWTLERCDVLGAHVPLDPPPLDADLPSPAALAMADVVARGARSPDPSLQNGAHATYEVRDAEVRFIAPASVVALVRDTMDAFAQPGEPRWTALERMLRHVIAYWTGIGRHRDPIFERDRWYCAVPACSSRRNLHDHHLRFRSRGGGNTRDNRIAICAAHHLHGIHAGWIHAWGTAPKPVYWEMGVRRDRPPLLAFIGDRLWNGDLPESPEVAMGIG